MNLSDGGIFYYLISALGVFISGLSQVLLKKEAMKKHDSFIKEYLNVRVITAYFIFFLASLMSIIAFKVVPLSFGPVIESTGYIYVFIFGHIFFGEKINKKKIVALGVIILGIIVFSLG